MSSQPHGLYPDTNSVPRPAPFQVVQKVKFFLQHLDHVQLFLLLLFFIFFLCPLFLWPLLPYRKTEDYWVSVTLALEKS